MRRALSPAARLAAAAGLLLSLATAPSDLPTIVGQEELGTVSLAPGEMLSIAGTLRFEVDSEEEEEGAAFYVVSFEREPGNARPDVKAALQLYSLEEPLEDQELPQDAAWIASAPGLSGSLRDTHAYKVRPGQESPLAYVVLSDGEAPASLTLSLTAFVVHPDAMDEDTSLEIEITDFEVLP